MYSQNKYPLGKIIVDKNEKRKQERISRKEKGICKDCSEKCWHGFSHCPECLDKMKDRRSKKAIERKRNGQCIDCKRDSGGSYRCDECSKRDRKIADARKQKIKEGETIDLKEVAAANDGKCAYCGEAKDEMTLDHILALSRGGKHERSNVTWACKECNLSKGSKLLSEWSSPLERNQDV